MQNTFRALEDVSRKLDQKTKEVDSLISRVNGKLAELNLATEVWLIYSPIEAGDYEDCDDEGNKCPRWREATLFGCHRFGQSWQLATKSAVLQAAPAWEGREYEVVANSHSLVPLSSQPEEIRLKAIRLLPELLEELKTEGNSFIEDIEKAEEAAETI